MLTNLIGQMVDLVIFAITSLCLFVVPHHLHLERPFSSFLTLSLTARHILVAALCLSTWAMILWSVGLYTPAHPRSFANYLFRCLIALNSCTAVLGLVIVVLRLRIDLWHALAVFWLTALLGMTAVRILFLLLHGVRAAGDSQSQKGS